MKIKRHIRASMLRVHDEYVIKEELEGYTLKLTPEEFSELFHLLSFEDGPLGTAMYKTMQEVK